MGSTLFNRFFSAAVFRLKPVVDGVLEG